MPGDYQIRKTGRENNFESVFAGTTASAACDAGAVSFNRKIKTTAKYCFAVEMGGYPVFALRKKIRK